MAVHPAYLDEQALRTLLKASEALAFTADKKTVVVPVDARHAWAVEQLLRWGYRVERMAVQMVLSGTDNGPGVDNWVDFARWAG